MASERAKNLIKYAVFWGDVRELTEYVEKLEKIKSKAQSLIDVCSYELSRDNFTDECRRHLVDALKSAE